MASKTYVLDTNVLIQAPHALHSFEDNVVVLPVAVMEELGRLKSDDGERSTNIRQVVRILDKLRSEGSLTKGVPLPSGGSLRIEMNCSNVILPEHWPTSKADNRILQVCKGLHEKGIQAFLVSRDIIARIKADILNIPAEVFLTDQAPAPDHQYRGRIEVLVDDNKFSTLKKEGIHPEYVYTLEDSRMRPIIDNLEILIDHDEKERYHNEIELRSNIDELFDRGIIVAEAMNFIRGRSITQTYLIIDEAQNLTPRQVKGIITRVGKGTKVILLVIQSKSITRC